VTEQLTYAQIAERRGISSEAARAIVKRHRLPRSRSNDGKTLVAVDLADLHHTPLPARSPRGDQSVADTVAALNARVAELETALAAKQAELVAEKLCSAGHRSDFERDRADRVVTGLVTELEALRRLLEAERAARPVTSRTWREMTWRERIGWLRTTG
jgi:hypothetical protein